MQAPDYRVGTVVWFWPNGTPSSVPPLAAIITADMGPDAPVGLHVFYPPGVYVHDPNVWASETDPDGVGIDHRFALIPGA
jgi:hypothetical protein